jgi:hypothetical protein
VRADGPRQHDHHRTVRQSGSRPSGPARRSTGSPPSSSTGAATASGVRPARCWSTSTSTARSARSRSRSGSAPSRPTCKPAGMRARSGSAAWAAATSALTPSYLPKLRGYLEMLLRNRERVRAAVELEAWARAEATPSDQEISRVRALIRRVETDLEQLGDEERRQVEEACRIVRATRQTVHLGMPTIRPPDLDPHLPEWRIRRDPPCRHHDLRAQILKRAAQALPDASLRAPARSAASRCWPTWPTSAPTTTAPRPARQARQAAVGGARRGGLPRQRPRRPHHRQDRGTAPPRRRVRADHGGAAPATPGAHRGAGRRQGDQPGTHGRGQPPARTVASCRQAAKAHAASLSACRPART